YVKFQYYQDSPMTLDNIEILHTFTDSQDEKWFYAVHIFLEKMGSRAVSAVPALIDAIARDDIGGICEVLGDLKDNINEIILGVRKMYGGCKPDAFYHGFRKFLGGWTNPDVFPNGMI